MCALHRREPKINNHFCFTLQREWPTQRVKITKFLTRIHVIKRQVNYDDFDFIFNAFFRVQIQIKNVKFNSFRKHTIGKVHYKSGQPNGKFNIKVWQPVIHRLQKFTFFYINEVERISIQLPLDWKQNKLIFSDVITNHASLRGCEYQWRVPLHYMTCLKVQSIQKFGKKLCSLALMMEQIL